MLDYLHVRVDEKVTKYRFIFNKKTKCLTFIGFLYIKAEKK